MKFAARRFAARPNLLVVLASLAFLAGCTLVRIGEPYDAQIESGLNAYYKSTAEFVKQAQLNASNPKGRYGSPESNAYYASSEGALSELKLRAEIIGGARSCPAMRLAGFVAGAAEEQLGEAVEVVGEDEADAPLDVSGNCTTLVIRNVQLSHDDLEADHKELGIITPPVAGLNMQAIDAAVRVALQTVTSHK